MGRNEKLGQGPEMNTSNQTHMENFKRRCASVVLGFGYEESPSMAKQVGWVIKDFSSLRSEEIYSDEFVVGGCKWRLKAFPKESHTSDLSLYLVVSASEYLPFGWKRHAKFSLIVLNQHSVKHSQVKATQYCFDENSIESGFTFTIRLDKLKARDGGFMVNNEVKIVAKVEVVEVIGDLDVLDGSLEAQQPLKKIKMDCDDSDLLKESPSDWVVHVNGFQVLSSQAESVKRIFEKHPDMAQEFRAKNQHLRTASMNVLLNLINTLCQPLQDLSNDDLLGADSALTYVKDSGFKVDWLEQKLEDVKGKKKEEQIGQRRMQELEEELNDSKQKRSFKEALLEKEKEELKNLKKKCSDVEAMLEKEKAKMLAAIATPLTLDDVV